MAVTVRFMQEEYFPRQVSSLPAFTERTGIAVETDLLPVDPFWNDARTACGSEPRWDLLVPDEVIVAELIHKGLLEPLGRQRPLLKRSAETLPLREGQCRNTGWRCIGFQTLRVSMSHDSRCRRICSLVAPNSKESTVMQVNQAFEWPYGASGMK